MTCTVGPDRRSKYHAAVSAKRGVTPGVGVTPFGRRWRDMWSVLGEHEGGEARWKSHILPKLDEAVIRELEEADTNEENSLSKSSSSRRGFRQNANYFTVE